jgi:hypothetical protein
LISGLVLKTCRARGQGCQMAYFQTKKIPMWVKLEGLAMEEVGIILWPLDLFMFIWYSLWAFGIFFVIWDIFVIWYIFPILVHFCCTKKNLAIPNSFFQRRRKKIASKNSSCLASFF